MPWSRLFSICLVILLVAPLPSQAWQEPAPESDQWVALFDGTDLEQWKVSNFGGEGECRLEGKTLIVEMGHPMSGMSCIRDDLPHVDYELELEAKRIDGLDFFCGLTFPVEDSHCTLIVGGWAGSLVGLSCLDDKDASDNETKRLMDFKDNQWYQIRVAVTADRIQAWIDDEEVVNVETQGRKISLRAETLPSRPLGISTFQTTAAYRNIRFRLLK